ncbi:MAG: MFS transporter [Bryobacteraceae bacterium]
MPAARRWAWPKAPRFRRRARPWECTCSPPSRARHLATGQIGISIGSSSAVLLAGWLAPSYGWRSAFVVAGALGFLWIPMWLAVLARPIAAPQPEQTLGRDPRHLAADPCHHARHGVVYKALDQRTTLFLAEHYHLTEKRNLKLARGCRPFFFTAGGLSGGALSIYLTRTASKRNGRGCP